MNRANRALGTTVSSGSLASSNSPMRPLRDLVAGLAVHEVRGDAAADVTDVVHRTDQVGPGALFFCVPGARADGHDLAAEAVARGAGVLVVERWLDGLDATQVLVRSTRKAMGPMSAAFFGRPSASMRVVGITGTNGKTTTAHLLAAVFAEAGMTPGLVGTTGTRVDDDPIDIDRTTPEAPELQGLLAGMVRAGVRAVAMEVSSHGLEQHRVDGTRFAAAVFTNLSRDHLDYHGTMDAYFESKARLFTDTFTDRAAICVDDPWGRRLAKACSLRTVTFGVSESAAVRAEDVRATASGLSFRVQNLEIRSALLGAFNVANCLATLAAARLLDIDDATTVRGIAAMPVVPGRAEAVDAGQPYLVLVDYAHTPEGVEQLLRAARGLARGRVIVVLGSGGDRDRGKRPKMARAATSLADLAILTSDNPRSEDPRAILAEMEPGARDGGGPFVVEVDRRAAIRAAVREAEPPDVVVIAGKGHETEQQVGDRSVPFDDRTVAADEIRAEARTGGESR
jgi:UDP-N-acetylmuramoyl-L-alanyl-D-glutamate--2,6-diaminopimelate ligase